MDTLMIREEVGNGLANDGGVEETTECAVGGCASEQRWQSSFICLTGFSSNCSFTVKRTSLHVRLATLLASRADSQLEKLI